MSNLLIRIEYNEGDATEVECELEDGIYASSIESDSVLGFAKSLDADRSPSRIIVNDEVLFQAESMGD